MPASSHASSELSTASLTAISSAFVGVSKPSRCLFFSKNSLTEISFCSLANSSAVFLSDFASGIQVLQISVDVRVPASFHQFFYRIPCKLHVFIGADDRDGLAVNYHAGFCQPFNILSALSLPADYS